ncbi:MAG: hypothetical protein ACRESZ_01020 [Methylococcales bacterium]
MEVLVWNDGTTVTAAREAIQAELAKLGHVGTVTWKGNEASASVSFGTVLSASVSFGTVLSAAGKVADEAVILDKCSGAVASNQQSRQQPNDYNDTVPFD